VQEVVLAEHDERELLVGRQRPRGRGDRRPRVIGGTTVARQADDVDLEQVLARAGQEHRRVPLGER
jgi:hypothetical protein